MFKRYFALLVSCLALTAVGAVRLQADTLNFTNGFTICPAGGCATVNIATNGLGTGATLTVSSLLNGYQFDSFGFNLANGSAITGFSSSGTVNTSGPNYGLSGPPGTYAQNGFGKFMFVFDTGINGGSTGGNCVVTGGSPSAGCTFTLSLTGTGLTSASVLQVLSSGGAGDGNTWFAGHVAGSACTGFVGGGNATGNTNGTSGCGTPVSEPSSLSLLGLGVLALLAVPLIRRGAFSLA